MAPEITIGITANNITADPQFIDRASGNYRLKSSPCVNAGVIRDWMTNSVDLDGGIRIRYGVDMGAYETINQGTIFKLH